MTSALTLRVAAFVKSPGLSPVKTRLAAGIGAAAAAEFYELACAAVEAVLAAAAAAGVAEPYWAVAEAAAVGLDRWGRLPVIAQGEGELGERLDRVYEVLLSAGGGSSAAALIGADAPQLTVDLLAAARAALVNGAAFVLGPAADGGFYLFAGRVPIPRRLWTSVPYSAATTAACFEEALAPFGSLVRLPMMTDVDVGEDLAELRQELVGLAGRLPEQERLLNWIEGVKR